MMSTIFGTTTDQLSFKIDDLWARSKNLMWSMVLWSYPAVSISSRSFIFQYLRILSITYLSVPYRFGSPWVIHLSRTSGARLVTYLSIEHLSFKMVLEKLFERLFKKMSTTPEECHDKGFVAIVGSSLPRRMSMHKKNWSELRWENFYTHSERTFWIFFW